MYCIHGDDPISSYILCLVPSYFTRCNRDDIDSICMIYLYKPSTEVVSSIMAKLEWQKWYFVIKIVLTYYEK